MPPAAVKEEKRLRWCLCPTCKGLGKVPSDMPERVLRGVQIAGHGTCPTCKGLRMVRTAATLDSRGSALYPIERCGLCGNYYATGAGHPPEEPCFQLHHKMGDKGGSHCHWHDLSVPSPEQVEGMMAELAARKQNRVAERVGLGPEA